MYNSWFITYALCLSCEPFFYSAFDNLYTTYNILQNVSMWAAPQQTMLFQNDPEVEICWAPHAPPKLKLSIHSTQWIQWELRINSAHFICFTKRLKASWETWQSWWTIILFLLGLQPACSRSGEDLEGYWGYPRVLILKSTNTEQKPLKYTVLLNLNQIHFFDRSLKVLLL